MKAYSDLTNRTEDCVDTMYHLINSSDENARAAIASQGFDDEYFSNDESPIVRIAVAEHTKDINILKNYPTMKWLLFVWLLFSTRIMKKFLNQW